MQFHESAIGVRFLEGTFPEFIEQIRRLNDNLEADRKAVAAVDRAEASNSMRVSEPDALADLARFNRDPGFRSKLQHLLHDETCGSCKWSGQGKDTNEGRCPKCDALAYPVSTEDQIDAIEEAVGLGTFMGIGDSDLSLEDWMRAVANCGTRRGYVAWVAHQKKTDGEADEKL